MKVAYKNGVTSVITRVKILDSTSTVGAGKTGLTSASSGLIVSTIADVEATATAYTAAGSTIDTITTLGTFATPTASHCRFKEVDSTNHPGVYEIQIANARWAVASARSIIGTIQVTGGVTVDFEVQLTGIDLNDGVAGGMSAIPSVASGSAGAILTDGTGTAQLQSSGGIVSADVKKINAISTGSVTQVASVIGTSATLIFTGTASGTLVNCNAVNVGGQTASAAGTVTFPGVVASATNITGGTITTVTNQTKAPNSGDFTATMKTSIGTTVAASAVASVTGNVGGNVNGKVIGGGATTITGVGVQADVQTINTQSIVCAASVTVGAFVGNATAAIAVDTHGALMLSRFFDLDTNQTILATFDVNGLLSVNIAAVIGDAQVATDGNGNMNVNLSALNSEGLYLDSLGRMVVATGAWNVGANQSTATTSTLLAINGASHLPNMNVGSYAGDNSISTNGSGLPNTGVAAIAAGIITSASFTVATISGVATGILEMIAQLWRRAFKKTVYDSNAQTIKIYGDDNTTVLTTQAATSTGGVDTQGPAS